MSDVKTVRVPANVQPAAFGGGEPLMMEVKLGRVAPKARPLVPRLAAFLPQVVSLPEKVDYSEKALASIKRMFKNDQFGCCVISGKHHQIGLWTGNDADSGGLSVSSDSEIVDQYNRLKVGPGDSGCAISDVLDYFVRSGLTSNGKTFRLDGYVSVDWRNADELKAAILLFGSVTFGVNLPQSWLNAPNGGLWDVTNSGFVGGHDICAVAYNETGVVIATWGGTRTITWAALASNRYVDECYAELAPSWYNADKIAPSGLDVEKLKAALDMLGHGQLPPIDPPTPPVPPVPPSPPVPPVPPVITSHGTVTIPAETFHAPAFGGMVTIPARSVPVTVTSGTAQGTKTVAWLAVYRDLMKIANDFSADSAVSVLEADLAQLARDLGLVA